jgi:hypothetical protein
MGRAVANRTFFGGPLILNREALKILGTVGLIFLPWAVAVSAFGWCLGSVIGATSACVALWCAGKVAYRQEPKN